MNPHGEAQLGPHLQESHSVWPQCELPLGIGKAAHLEGTS